MTEATNEQIKQRQWLEVFEERAHNALVKAEGGWREFTEQMREIKRTEAYKEKGYRYFQPYYKEVWEDRVGRTWYTVETAFSALRALEEFEDAAGQGRDLDPPSMTAARVLRRELSEPGLRVEAWHHHLDSGRVMGHNREGLRESIAEYKGEHQPGVIDRMRERGTLVPAYPTGPTPEEEAYNAASQLLSVAMDVTPEAAADSISPGLAQTTAQRYEALIPWTRRFVAQLHFRAGGGR